MDIEELRLSENTVLGNMMRWPDIIDEIAGGTVGPLVAEDFSSFANQCIFNTVMDIHSSGQHVDMVATANELHKRQQIEDIGGYKRLAELWDHAPSPSGVRHHVKVVRERGVFRRLATAAEKIQQEAKSPTGTSAEALEMAQSEIFGVAEAIAGEECVDAKTVVREMYDAIDVRSMNPNATSGVPTGLVDLDHLMGGLQPSSMVILAARTSVGKTSLAMAIAWHVAVECQLGVLVASLEMSRLDIMERLTCAAAEVDTKLMRSGKLSSEECDRVREKSQLAEKSPLRIDDGGRQSVLRIASNARRLKRRSGLGLVIVDYIQLVEPDNPKAQRYEQVGSNSRRIKAMAKDLKAPVLALAQLNRGVEDRAGQKPRLSDLRESGSLEMDADTVMLMHRPNESSSEIEVNVAKQRSGPTGSVTLTFVEKFARFQDYLSLIR